MPVRGEAAEYTLEVVKYDKDSRGTGTAPRPWLAMAAAAQIHA